MRILTTATGDELTERNIITLMQKVARLIMFCKCELIIQNQTSHDGDKNRGTVTWYACELQFKKHEFIFHHMNVWTIKAKHAKWWSLVNQWSHMITHSGEPREDCPLDFFFEFFFFLADFFAPSSREFSHEDDGAPSTSSGVCTSTTWSPGSCALMNAK